MSDKMPPLSDSSTLENRSRSRPTWASTSAHTDMSNGEGSWYELVFTLYPTHSGIIVIITIIYFCASTTANMDRRMDSGFRKWVSLHLVSYPP